MASEVNTKAIFGINDLNRICRNVSMPSKCPQELNQNSRDQVSSNLYEPLVISVIRNDICGFFTWFGSAKVVAASIYTNFFTINKIDSTCGPER